MGGVEADPENNQNADENGSNSSARTYNRSSSSSSADEGSTKPQLPHPQPAGYRNKRHVDNLRIPAQNFGSSNPTTPRISNGLQPNYVDPSSINTPYLAPPPTPAATQQQQQQQYLAMAWRGMNLVPPTPTAVTFQPPGSNAYSAAYTSFAPLLTTPGWQTPRTSNGFPTFFSLPSAAPPSYPQFGYPSGAVPPAFNMNQLSPALPFIPNMPSAAPMFHIPYGLQSNFGFGAASGYGFNGNSHTENSALDAMRQQIIEALNKPSQGNSLRRGTPGTPQTVAESSPKAPRFESRRDGSIVAYVDVDSRELAAEVVGKKGRNIKGIEQMTECRIQAPVHDDGSLTCSGAGSGSLVFTILGDEAHARQAVIELRRRIELVKSIQHDRSNRARPSHGQIVRHLAVPTRLVSFIVGHQGQEINRVADRCGCYILSPKEDRDALFHIVGTEPNTRQCVQRICDFIWKREQQSLFKLLQNETFRRESPGEPDYTKSPSECRKLCGYFACNLGSGTELLSGIEMRPPRTNTNSGSSRISAGTAVAPAFVPPPLINHPDMRLSNLGSTASDDDELASSGYSGTGDHSEREVSPPELGGGNGGAHNGAALVAEQNGAGGYLPAPYDGSALTSPVGTTCSSLSGSVAVGNGDEGSPASVHNTSGVADGGVGRVTSAQPTPLHAGNFVNNGILNNSTPANVGVSPVRPSFQQHQQAVISRQSSSHAAPTDNSDYSDEAVVVGNCVSPTTPSYRTQQQSKQFLQQQHVVENGGNFNGSGYRDRVYGGYNNVAHVAPVNAYPAHYSSVYVRGGSNASFGTGGGGGGGGGNNTRMFRPGPQNQ